MSGTATNVTAGKPNNNGAAFSAPVGSTLPTDAITALDAAFTDLGFLSEDGLTRSRSLSSTTIKEWGGLPVLITDDEDITTFKFKLIEYLNTDVQKVINGDDNVTGTLATGLAIQPGDMQERAFVFWQRMRGGVSHRIVVPRGKITEVGDVVFKSNEAVAYDVTVTAMNDGNKKPYYEYAQTVTEE